MGVRQAFFAFTGLLALSPLAFAGAGSNALPLDAGGERLTLDNARHGALDSDEALRADGCIQGDLSLYFGMFHSHTQYSDGEQFPEDAYAWARDEGGLDVFALTDHLEQLYVPQDVEKWATTNEIADAFDVPGRYVALAGFEYGSGFDRDSHWMSFGHNNVFFADELMPAIMLDYKLFYSKLLGCIDCLAQFNHPWDTQTNWDGFQYYKAVDPQMSMIELPKGAIESYPFYFEALDQGWHVGPARNQDNHSADWGTKDDSRTGLWLADLTRESVRDAMENRRTFSTMDRNASLALMTSDGCWMGSIITGRPEISWSWRRRIRMEKDSSPSSCGEMARPCLSGLNVPAPRGAGANTWQLPKPRNATMCFVLSRAMATKWSRAPSG